LLKEFLITKEPLPGNRKEHVINLTPLGMELFNLHKDVHQKFDSDFASFLCQYNTEELHFIIQFLTDFKRFKQKEK